jgi:hypothetical protein
MVTKKPKSTTKKAISKPKEVAKKNQEETPYSGLILIASIILLFVIVVPKGERPNDNFKGVVIDFSEESNSTSESEPITISGKMYISSEEAYKVLQPQPQTRRTSAETKFVESYKGEENY